VVRKIRSPHITGVEKPRPGIAIFHLMFFVSLNSTGAAVRAMPLKKGPRHCGQCAGSELAELPTGTTAANVIKNSRPVIADNRFIIHSPPVMGSHTFPAPEERNVYRCVMYICSLAPEERHLRWPDAAPPELKVSATNYKHYAPLERGSVDL